MLQRVSLALSLCALLLLFACAPSGTAGSASSGEKPTTLDLRDKGLTDVGNLLERTELTAIDLRGNELSRESFDTLQAALPNCSILWSVPLAGARHDSDSTALSLDSATRTQVRDLLLRQRAERADADAQMRQRHRAELAALLTQDQLAALDAARPPPPGPRRPPSEPPR